MDAVPVCTIFVRIKTTDNMKRFFFSFLACACCMAAIGQRNNLKDYVTVTFVPNHADWVYEVGETVRLDVSVRKHYVAVPNQEITYEWGMEQREALEAKTTNTGKGIVTLDLKGASEPGFMTCKVTTKVDGRTYSNYITVGFDPQDIKPTTQLPPDFTTFWEAAINDARKTPLEPLMTLQPDLCTPFADVYHVRFQNTQPGTYLYGILSVPKKEGVFPAVLRVPGAGVRAYSGDKSFFPEHDVITLEIGIHGIPVNLPAQVYADLRENALWGYNTYNNDDRDRYYYKKVYVGCVRAVDFLCSLPNVDTERLAVYGGSQGGALSIVTAALDKRIKCLSAAYPALAEIAGYHHGRAAGWPKIFKNPDEVSLLEKVQVSEYYDVVNFARFITVPGLYIWGYNDQVCCPTSTYSVFNVITAPKQLLTVLDCAHWLYPEHAAMQKEWLLEELKK